MRTATPHARVPPHLTGLCRTPAISRDASKSRPLHGAAAAKIAMFRERLALVHQRLMRHKAFAPRRFNTARKGRQTIKVRAGLVPPPPQPPTALVHPDT